MATSTSTPSTFTPGIPVASPSSATLPSGVASSDSTGPFSGIAGSSTTPPGQSTTTPPITPSSSPISTTFSSSPSHSPQTPIKSVSTTGSHDSVSSSSAHTSPTNSSNPATHRLANGLVAGIVIAVAVGIALLTFLVTFFIMRRRQESKRKGRYRSSKDSEGLELKPPRQQDPTSTPKTPFVTEASGLSGTNENYLPQSADDRTIQQKTKATLDQIELHVENFYRNSSSSAPRLDNAELAVFDSPYLPASLTSLLPRSKNRINLMKHALAQSVTSSISLSASPARSLLPTEYGLVPSTVTSARSNVSTKAGSGQIMSQWRIMTAYLRPDPTKDAAYIAQRNRQINDTVQSFAKAFAPWKNTGYKDEERARSLAAILEDAATLGIFLFSQPATLKFHWPTSGEVGPGRIVVSPALVKTTDEKGQDLMEAQVMVQQVVLDA